MKIAFALGGGGARGIAHIGVIKALLEAGVKPQLITGSSMGAIVGALYARSADIYAVEKRIREYLDSDEFRKLNLKNYNPANQSHSFLDNAVRRFEKRIVINLTISEIALFKQKHFLNALNFFLGDNPSFENLRLPFAAVAADLISGEKFVFTSGNLITAVLASSSIPAFLPPVDYQGMKLVDGEVVELIPCETAASLGANFIIAVDVRQPLDDAPQIDNALDVFFRAAMIKSHRFAERTLKADIVIKPDVSNCHWTAFENTDALIEAGYRAGIESLDLLKRKLRIRKLLFWKK